MEHWVPLFHDAMETLLDYLPGASVSLDHQADDVLAARLEMIADHYAARRMVPRDGETPYRPLPPERLYLDRAGWDAMLAGGPLFAFSPVRPAGRRGGHRWRRPAGADPRSRQAAAGGQRVRPVARPGRALGGRGAAADRRRLDPRLARADRATCCASTASRTEPADDWAAVRRRPPGTVALVTLGLERGFVAETSSAARLPVRTGPAGRAHQPPAAPAQAGRPVHRRGDRDRRGRPGRAPGPRHRPLRRAGDAAPSTTRRTTACACSTTATTSCSCRSRTSRCCPASAARARGVALDKLGGVALADAQGADEAAHPRHGGRADPHRRRAPACATPR